MTQTNQRKYEYETNTYLQDSVIIYKTPHRSLIYKIILEGKYPPEFKLLYIRKPGKYKIPNNYIFRVVYGDEHNDYVEFKESPSAAANLYQKVSAQKQIKSVFHNDDVVILNEIKFTINSHSYSVVYNQHYNNTEELRLLAIIKAMDVSKISRSAYRTIANLSLSLPREWSVSEAKKQLMYNMASQIKTTLFDLSTNLLNNLTELIDEEIHFNDQNIVESVIESVGKGTYRSIKDILAYLIPTLSLVIAELKTTKKFDSKYSEIIEEMKRINVYFEFWQEKGTTTGSWKYTSLIGSDKLKVLYNFNFAKILPNDHAILVCNL
ncbi:23033_t:CDS:2 [Cetraspora pellucida]|uniref:23033_t:CDS:1 n=1 Tax=Cetraspora pellucida TaxID=1433469 RepID=A0A9N9CZJ7_9GLOM|nr:23033_t:CDS:2 [Cetraspora pellucida]